ncbi:MAG: PLP-dependent transferase, partial [Stackebrandtia sp.]
IRIATGGVLHPLAGYLLHRGLATLPVRVRAQAATAHELAVRLAKHPNVATVHYPGLRHDRPAQMDTGGSLLAFETTGDAAKLIAAVRLITPAVSLGSVDTLIQHPASLTHHIVAADDRHTSGVNDRLVRVSIGLEDMADLWDDLNQALDRS